jgi:hypothetical protein
MIRKFACSLLATRDLGAGMDIRHSVCLVEAWTWDDAIAAGLAICRNAYPEAAGWIDHHAVVCRSTNFIDPTRDVVRSTEKSRKASR